MTAPLCILTRPEALSRAFAAELPGLAVLIAPILRIEPLEFDANRLARARGMVFTSANAVPFAGPARGRPALCVGAETGAAARAMGWQVTEGPGDAAGLMPLLAGHEDFLHLHGRHVARVLPVAGMAVYDQVAVPPGPAFAAAIRGARPLILPVFSPRSGALLADAMADARAPVATVAISARADQAYDGPTGLRVIAEHPSRAGMLRAILSLAGTERSPMPWVEAERGGR
ncbi:MAG: uroporphyrinogen-III synthase [Paracoccus sp. (in: a-proteobacteria)]|nr:uroporphyrinogen-III synthase [Paracoccus sp. (in: a-proteobacteria)]